MFVQENDKIYVIKEGQVIASMSKDAYYGECKHPECEEHGKTKYDLEKGSTCGDCGTAMHLHFPNKEEKESKLDFGSRVSYREKTGSVISIIPSVYGDTIGVKFDDGQIAEFMPEQLTRLADEERPFTSGIDGVVADYEEYAELPADTLEQLEIKEKVARSLNLRAASLITNKQLTLGERIKLDSILTATGVDALDFKESKELLRIAENESYLTSRPKYNMAHEIPTWGSLARTKGQEDISWVDTLETPNNDAELNWELHLASLAKDAVDQLTTEQLTDQEFMTEVEFFNLKNLPIEHHSKFKMLLGNAAEMKVDEPVLEKTAKVEEDFSSVDDSALFL